MIFKNKKQFLITKENKERIEKEIDDLSLLPDGIYTKVKELEMGYYIKIIIDRKKLGIEQKKDFSTSSNFGSVPECITFLMIVDYSYPASPPKIISKTTVILYFFIF